MNQEATPSVSALEPASGPRRPSASLSAVGLVSGLTVVQLLLQFAIHLLLARYFGTAGEVDAFMAALALPLVVAAMVSGSLGYVIVPVIAEALARGSAADAAAVARQIGLGLIGLSLAITVLVAALALPLAKALCPGFLPAEQALTGGLLRGLSILILANCLIAYLNALYHAFGRFTRPAVAGVIGTFVTLLYVWLFHQAQGIYAVTYGVNVGAFVTIAILLPLFVFQFQQPGLRPLALHPGTRRCLGLLTPLVLGAVVWRLDPLVDRFLGSFLDQGSIAQMGYAARLTTGLMLIGTSGLSIVAFPAIAAHAAAGRRQDFSAEVAHALRFFLVLMVPICVGASLFAAPVVRLLYEHGKFTAGDTQAVALFLALSGGLIMGSGLGDLLSRTCYADQDMRTPVVVSLVTFALAVALKWLLVTPFGAAGIVAATSAYSVLYVLLLGGILLTRLSGSILTGTTGSTLRAVIGSLLACAAAGVVMLLLPWRWAVVPAAAVGAVSYALVMWLQEDEFARQFAAWLAKGRGRESLAKDAET